MNGFSVLVYLFTVFMASLTVLSEPRTK